MKKYLYIKFILAIILLGLLGFSAISLAGGKLMQEHVESVYSEKLYREATHIAQYPLIRSYQTIENQATVYNDLCTLSTYQNASIWLISAKGEILLDVYKRQEYVLQALCRFLLHRVPHDFLPCKQELASEFPDSPLPLDNNPS